jgi:F0F1-type ATP synthase assembly protein I
MDNKNPKKSKPNNEILRYSGLAFQMIATICVGVAIGKIADHYLHTPKPYCTGICAVLFVALAMYQSIKDFIKK